jgi:G patch domain-containing protein 1
MLQEIKAFSIGATQDYDQFGAVKAEKESKRLLSDNIGLENTALSDIAKHIAGDLITSSTDSIGSRLLRQMGWREGQGVGPRVKRQRGIANKDEDVHSSGFSFAPSNSSILILNAKKDKFGIGYQLDREAQPVIEANRGKSSGGFGVGIFEEEDDDVYHNDTTEYEVTLENDQVQNVKNNSRIKKTLPGKLCKDGLQALSGFVIVGTALMETIK